VLGLPLEEVAEVVAEVEAHGHDILVALDVLADDEVEHGALGEALDAVNARAARRVNGEPNVAAIIALRGRRPEEEIARVPPHTAAHGGCHAAGFARRNAASVLVTDREAAGDRVAEEALTERLLVLVVECPGRGVDPPHRRHTRAAIAAGMGARAAAAGG
jgi:hypothetical protein